MARQSKNRSKEQLFIQSNATAVSWARSNGVKQKPINQAEEWYFESVRQWIYKHTGLHFSAEKRPVLYQRLKQLCWRLDIHGLKELDQHLRKRDFPNLAVEMARAISTNHTYFFREEEIMQFFQTQIVPHLPAKDRLRIWSAASSSGEEAYTIALILAETMGLGPARNRVSILGSDINPTVIEQAEHGIYDERTLEKVPQHLRQQYFHPLGLGQWGINPALKQMCTFRRLNLISKPWPFRNSFHVVLCRNVLYYFDRAQQQELVERAYEATLAGGWLITSVTESLWDINTRWQAVTAGVYRKE